MTGVFYVRKSRNLSLRKKLKRIILGGESKYDLIRVEGNPSPDFEAIDFLNNGGLHVAIYEALCRAHTGDKLEIVVDLEE